MLKDFTMTETGLISIIGMFMAFALACCKGIQQSRCSNISTPCISCDREVIDPETLLEMRKMDEDKKDSSKIQDNL